MALFVFEHDVYSQSCLLAKKLSNNQSQLVDVNIRAYNLATRVNWSYIYE